MAQFLGLQQALRRFCGIDITLQEAHDYAKELTSDILPLDKLDSLAAVMQYLYASELVKHMYEPPRTDDNSDELMIAVAKRYLGVCDAEFADNGLFRCFLRPEDMPLPPVRQRHDLRLIDDAPENVAQSCGFLFSSKRTSDYAAAGDVQGGALKSQPQVQGVRLSTIIDIRLVFTDAMWSRRFSEDAIDWLSERTYMDMVEIAGPQVIDNCRMFACDISMGTTSMQLVCSIFLCNHVLCKLFVGGAGPVKDMVNILLPVAAGRAMKWAHSPENQPCSFRPAELRSPAKLYYPHFLAARLRFVATMSNAQPRSAGERIQILGLQSDAGQALNGQFGKLVKWHASSGRWDVQLDDGSERALKPENLRGAPLPLTQGFAEQSHKLSVDDLVSRFSAMGFLDKDVKAALADMASSSQTSPDCNQLLEAIMEVQERESSCAICFMAFGLHHEKQTRQCCRQTICASCNAQCEGRACFFCRQ